MKFGFLGPIGGLIAAAIIITLFVGNTPVDSPLRWLGFALGLLAFGAGAFLGYGGKDGNPPTTPTAV